MIDVGLDDRLYFQVNMNEGDSFDTTVWNPIITYEDGTAYQASEGFNDKQGQNQWYYHSTGMVKIMWIWSMTNPLKYGEKLKGSNSKGLYLIEKLISNFSTNFEQIGIKTD